MNPLDILLKWLSETIKRLFQKSPKYFKIWTLVGTVLFIMTGLPGIIDWAIAPLGIHLPAWMTVLSTKMSTVASAIILFMSRLTIDDTTIKSPEKTLPFTTNEEVK